MVYKLYLLLKLTSCDKWLLSICLFVCLSNWHLGDENNSFRNWINMCLEVKRKWKKIQFILVLLCFLIEKFKNHVRIPKRDTVIQNGSQNEVVVIACYILWYQLLPFAKKVEHAMAVKKEMWQKSIAKS